MRLITRTKLYRAFPELDSYDDAQCERFIKAAMGARSRRVVRWFVCVVASLTSLLLIGTAIVQGWQTLHKIGPQPEFAGTFLAVFAAAAWPMLAFVLRDRLLARRIRRLLRVTGLCTGCGYSLIGMPLDSVHRVTCPECGATKQVDPSLAMLVKDELGRVRIESLGQAPELPPFWTPGRRRLAKRTVFVGAMLFVVIPTVLLGLYEGFLRYQATQARKSRVPPETLLAIVERAQPQGAGPGSPDAWAAFDEADAIARRVNQAANRLIHVFTDEPPFPAEDAFEYLMRPPASVHPADIAQSRYGQWVGTQMLRQYEAAGVFAKLAEMSERPRAMREPRYLADDEERTLLSRVLPWLGRSRRLARVSAARMRVAIEENRLEVFADSLDHVLALASMNCRQGSAIEQLAGTVMDNLAMNELRHFIPTCRQDAWLTAIEEVLARRRLDADAIRMVEVERLGGLDYNAYFFSEASRVRFGRFSPRLIEEFGRLSHPVGTFHGSESQIQRYYDECRAILERNASSAIPTMPGNVSAVYGVGIQDALSTTRLALANHSGMRVAVAIRRFELANGTPPGTLEQLVPSYLRELPDDPFGSGSCKFIRVDPSMDRIGRSYLIYSVGLDGFDDGGNEFSGVAKAYREVPGMSAGTDYVFNTE